MRPARTAVLDRKSTRLNSSHVAISYAVFCLKMTPPPPRSTLFPYTTLFRSEAATSWMLLAISSGSRLLDLFASCVDLTFGTGRFQLCAILADVPSGRRLVLPNEASPDGSLRSEEHTSELQSRGHLVCRLLLENDPATTPIYTLSLHDALPI